jgi:hypothetical protein
VKARVVKISKSMIAQVGKGFIVLVNGRILEKCKVLLEDSRYLIVQFSPSTPPRPPTESNPMLPSW